ncbi:MAG: arsenite methyltransferase [Candidatus Bathyarchaeota archaeon]|nr:MAG: arsenite methyltransferase [Candidatus Bathyarchaeota archaeon]
MVKENEDIKEYVKERYSAVAKRTEAASGASCCDTSASASCCGPTSKAEYAQRIGYDLRELSELPDTAIGASAGCGNPTALAGLKEGEVVLDLGSGGGIDVFLAAKKVGPTGKAIGVDMTQEMIDLAMKNAEEVGFQNVEFRKGDIEDLPVEDETVDVIISNCVINLAPDKDRVFSEAYRVLRPGGRIMVSDIVTDGGLPEEVRNNPDAWAACVAGALDEKVYMEKIRNAGFKDVRVIAKRSGGRIYSAEFEAHKPK